VAARVCAFSLPARRLRSRVQAWLTSHVRPRHRAAPARRRPRRGTPGGP